ncbi:hypothetical protein O181_021272 [Austropuccinia psidii MF-1]|uniref:DNA-directed RNA polymerase n=1 Tax=Austropuccinia psidii MF-1 TaxID=1389203 RepID=A0A9Q3GW37_9BASI|nr:hypothetical protein [Austropuccinia psidii MF-1]
MHLLTINRAVRSHHSAFFTLSCYKSYSRNFFSIQSAWSQQSQPQLSSSSSLKAVLTHESITQTEDHQTPNLYQSPFHLGTISNYLRPPLPPNLISNSRNKANQLIDYSSFYQGFNSSKAQDQISQLVVSIAIGDLSRAKSIIFQIERSLGYIRPTPFEACITHSINENKTRRAYRSEDSINENLPMLHEIVHTSIFGSLLRKTLLQAFEQESLGNSTKSNLLQAEVYEWMMNFRTNGDDWSQIDHHILAGVLKGVLFLKEPVFTALDYMPWVLPHSASHIYTSISTTSKPPTLGNILDSITFVTSQTKSFFGKLDKYDALSKIKTEAMSQSRQDVLKEVEEVERLSNQTDQNILEPDLSNKSHSPFRPPTSLNPVKKPLKTSDDPTAERQVPMRLSHLLSNVSTIPESAHELFSSPFDRQMVLEYAGYDSAEAEWFEGHKEIKERGVGFSNGDGGKVLQAWMWQWWHDLKRWFDDLEAQNETASDSKKDSLTNDLAFIKVLNNSLVAKVAVVEAIREMSNSTITDGAKSIGLFIALGKAIENEWYAQTIKSIPELNQKLLNSIKSANQSGLDSSHNIDHNVRKLWRSEIGNYTSELKAIHGDSFDWTIQQRSKVGALVMRGLLETAKITRSTTLEDGSQYEEVQPAFYQTTQYFDGKRIGVTKMNEAVAERLDRDPANVTLHPRYLPMVSLPLPWSSPKNGAYLVHGAPLMRTKDSPEQNLHVMEAHRHNGLEPIYKALDKLGQTAWAINRPIFDIMATVWNSGQELAGIPIRDPHVNLTFEGIDGPQGLVDGELNHENEQENPRSEGQRREIYRSLLASRRSAYGQRCSVNYQLEIAKAYLHETFYFPHNVDFRGRAYPIPANLNHIGDDISRGLLTFADRKQLGERGLFWLKVHLSNKAGFDKASLEEREKFVDNHLSEIFDSADYPLEGKRWWLESEDPWQTLAACIELTNALRSDDPVQYSSHLPVHQDGSCNGLQHYAALGGDIEGGKEVNLVPGEKPGDVYSKVAAEVNKLVDEDAKNGHDIAKALQGHIKRKVVKQTVMTTVYGVTFVGAREQIRRQLKDLGVIPIPNLYISAAYVATLVLRSIGEVFRGAVAIQQWLTFVARLVSKSIPPERVRKLQNESTSKTTFNASLQKSEDELELMTSMTWTTPLGLVVCQPYRTQNRTQIKTVLQTVYIADPHEPAQADARGQASAFPPNFIHSLDATHMMLTALACQDITFASVHDSYWTHAADIDAMSEKLRESFVKLHTTRILENLAEEIKHRYEGYKIPKSSVTTRMIGDMKSMGLVQVDKILSNHSTLKTNETKGNDGHENSDKRYIELIDLIPPLPPRGNLNIEDVLQSRYFFA